MLDSSRLLNQWSLLQAGHPGVHTELRAKLQEGKQYHGKCVSPSVGLEREELTLLQPAWGPG